VEQHPAPTPRRFPPGWAAPGSSAGATSGADEPTIEQQPTFREAPTTELAAPTSVPPPPPPPTGFEPPFQPPARAEPSSGPSRPGGAIPPPPLPRPSETDRTGPVLPDSPPTYESSPFGSGGGALPPLPAYVRPEPAPTSGPSRVAVAVMLACSALVAAIVTGALFLAFDRNSTPAAAPPSSRLEGSSGLDIQGLLAKAQPSVVTIHTDESSSSTGQTGGAGTGVIVSADGDVLTNAHVVARAQTVRVTLDDGTEYPADVIGSFPDADVALVRVQGASDLTPAQLGNSSEIRVGDEVVAIGNALNLGASPSVTRGIISALDRIIEAPDVTLRGLLQTDAAINPGNSGGPLLDAAGEVIGINTAIAADAQNIGFAIPIDDIKPLIDELRQGRGEVTPETAFLGVSTKSVADLSSDELDQFGISASRGAVVTEVAPDSPAADAGLEVGDVIVALDGQSITTGSQLVDSIRSHEPGDKVTVEYERDGRKHESDITLDRRGG
jgi:putative serine protease PepD